MRQVPLPHPSYPLVSLLIWCYSDFSKEEGGTYLVPGSHVDEQGNNRVTPQGGFEDLVPVRSKGTVLLRVIKRSSSGMHL